MRKQTGSNAWHGVVFDCSAMGTPARSTMSRFRQGSLKQNQFGGTRPEKLQRAKNAETLAIQQWKQRNGNSVTETA